MKPVLLLRAVAALCLFALAGAPAPARAVDAPDEVVVFAAASTTNALDEIGALFAAKGLGTMKGSYAASSTLARQIEQGAPANLFLSADQQWMDYLAGKQAIDPATRRDLLGNALVLIAPAASPTAPVTIDEHLHFARLLDGGRLSTGDPDAVPVGIYARQALTRLHQWQAVEPHLARAESVRAALALVERGEAPLGIVYSTDAMVTRKVKIVGTFPAALHDPIAYPVALVAGHETPAARKFLDFLQSDEAKAVFRRYGFTTSR